MTESVALSPLLHFGRAWQVDCNSQQLPCRLPEGSLTGSYCKSCFVIVVGLDQQRFGVERRSVTSGQRDPT